MKRLQGLPSNVAPGVINFAPYIVTCRLVTIEEGTEVDILDRLDILAFRLYSTV